MATGLVVSGALCAAVLSLTACGESKEASTNSGRDAPASKVLFLDVTESSGINFVHDAGAEGRRYLPETMGPGGCALDFDGDGFCDVYLVQSGPIPGATARSKPGNKLFRNRGDGTFEDVSKASRTDDQGYGQGAVAADYDNDGDLDIYVLNFGPNVLLRNDGDGRFSDVTEIAGVADSGWGSSASFFDAEGDGDLDLYVVNYLDFSVARHKDCGKPHEGHPAYCHPDVYPHAPDRFFRNLGNGTFEEASRECGFVDADGKGLGVVVADLVGDDGRPDVYVANDSTPNFLYQNQGGGKFEDVGLFLGVSHNEDGATQAGMGVDVGDVNGDGRYDIIVTNLSMESNALYLGAASMFVHGTRVAGLFGPSLKPLGFGCDLLDLDNDGDLDLFVANGHVVDNIEVFNDALRWKQSAQVLLNDGQGHFEELAAERLGAPAEPRVARGSITLDFDNDGRLDQLVLHNRDRARLFRNTEPSAGHWVGFHLVGTSPCNRGAVGAEVTVIVGDRSLRDVVKAGSSYQTSSDPRLHFGLGSAASPSRVEVRWPEADGQVHTERLPALSGDAYWRIVRGKPPERLRQALRR